MTPHYLRCNINAKCNEIFHNSVLSNTHYQPLKIAILCETKTAIIEVFLGDPVIGNLLYSISSYLYCTMGTRSQKMIFFHRQNDAKIKP